LCKCSEPFIEKQKAKENKMMPEKVQDFGNKQFNTWRLPCPMMKNRNAISPDSYYLYPIQTKQGNIKIISKARNSAVHNDRQKSSNIKCFKDAHSSLRLQWSIPNAD